MHGSLQLRSDTFQGAHVRQPMHELHLVLKSPGCASVSPSAAYLSALVLAVQLF